MSDEQETSADATERVIARIQKLLAKTKDGSGTSEAEAESATRMVQDLLLKHNLDMATIEAAEARGAINAPDVERVKEMSKSKVRFKWQRTLARYVAEAHFCFHLIQTKTQWTLVDWKPCTLEGDHSFHDVNVCRTVRGSSARERYGDYGSWSKESWVTTKEHLFVGRRANVITAQLVFEYLTETIENLVPLEDNRDRFSRAAASWKLGCAYRLCERLSQRRKDLIEANDVRVQVENAARVAEAKAAHDAKIAAQARALMPNEGAEVAAELGELDRTARAAPSAHDNGDAPEAPEPDAEPFDPGALEESPSPETGTALVLASVYDEREREANEEIAWGFEPGHFARERAEREKEEAEEAQREAEEDMAAVDAPVREETERQRRAREKREDKEDEQRRRRLLREDEAESRKRQREYDKLDHSAYRAGGKAGESIGLDLQLKAKAERKRLT